MTGDIDYKLYNIVLHYRYWNKKCAKSKQKKGSLFWALFVHFKGTILFLYSIELLSVCISHSIPMSIRCIDIGFTKIYILYSYHLIFWAACTNISGSYKAASTNLWRFIGYIYIYAHVYSPNLVNFQRLIHKFSALHAHESIIFKVRFFIPITKIIFKIVT